MSERYDHEAIEKKWQEAWAKLGLFKAVDDSSKPKTYVLDMFPYPSGEGLHVGHPKGYIATDVYSRHMRMRGHNVLHPMGWDAFGLPAENFAIKNKVHPRVAVEQNIANFKSQLAHIGFDYDWSREINTTDPGYYKWTQWIFLKLLEKGLAYQSNEPINWCPSCMTGLANEDLDGNVCERCGTVVEKKSLPQWVLKITAYADRMLEDLNALKWPEHIKEAQRNWIGRSEGSEISFAVEGTDKSITVFTTRADTLFGATYLVLAPEHPLVPALKDRIDNWQEVVLYLSAASTKSDIERSAEGKEKTGVELKGVRAINPATKKEIPVFVADYVLGGYGTGAIMAVPAHDERDYEFAAKFNLPIVQVLEPVLTQTAEPGAFKQGEPFVHTEAIIAMVKHWSEDKYIGLKWKQVAWGTFLTGGIDEGMSPEDTVRKEILEETGYKNIKNLRELGMIHSRFYHVPKQLNKFTHAHVFEVELADGVQEPVDPSEQEKHDVFWLDTQELESFLTATSHIEAIKFLKGKSVYAGPGILTNSGGFNGLSTEEAKKKITEFVGGKLTVNYKIRDWVFSRQRYWGEPIPVVHCAKDGVVPVPESELPVLLPEVESYEPSGTGESPLANITEWVNTTCPACGGPAKRETNTMPQWAGSSWYYLRFMDPHNDAALVAKDKEKYWAPVDVYVGGDHAVRHLIYARFWHKFLYDIGAVSTIEPFARLEFLGFILAEDGRKMSKRYGNIINPDDVVATYGADTFRLYEMFMGPFENTVAWSEASIAGTKRFIERVWRLSDKLSPDTKQEKTDTVLHQTIKKVTDDIEAFKFNTAVSQMMILLNAAEAGGVDAEQWKVFLRLLAPFAPHITEELWHKTGEQESVHLAPWPLFDESKLVSATSKLGVQVNGKLRATLELSPTATESEALAAALATPAIQKWLDGKSVSRTVYVPGKILSLSVA